MRNARRSAPTTGRSAILTSPDPTSKLERSPDVAEREWRQRSGPVIREYAEVFATIAGVTFAGLLAPLSYHTYGLIYLLAVILLSLRVGRWQVLAAAITSAGTWIYFFIPPRLAFSGINLDDQLLLGTYAVVALVAGQLTARIRAQEREERLRERRATALFHLTRAIAEARTLDEAVTVALRQSENLFEANAALWLMEHDLDKLKRHPASSFEPSDEDVEALNWVRANGAAAGRFTNYYSHTEALYAPLLRAGRVLGVFAVRMPAKYLDLRPEHRELVDGFGAQIALLVEREQFRAASEREKLLIESERLHRTLLDSVSHELKTPLAVLRAAAEKITTDDAKKREQMVTEVFTAISRLDRLVANLLDQTRLEAGGITAQLDWCDVHDLVHAARRAVGDALNSNSIKIDIPADLPLLLADAPLMEHALANLLLNASLHTPPGTSIEVNAGLGEFDARPSIYISVADRGPGISADLREHLFQKFRRGNAVRSGGLGLGLSIVRGFMIAQDGGVIVDDNPGGGACFTIYLPYLAHSQVPDDDR